MPDCRTASLLAEGCHVMTKEEVFERTGETYLCLIHPVVNAGACRRDIAPMIALSEDIPDASVASLIAGD